MMSELNELIGRKIMMKQFIFKIEQVEHDELAKFRQQLYQDFLESGCWSIICDEKELKYEFELFLVKTIKKERMKK